MKAWLFFMTAACLSTLAYADRTTPTSPDTVIASWPVVASAEVNAAKTDSRLHPNNPEAIVKLANLYIAQAAQPGQSRLYGLAQAALQPLIESGSENADVWLAWAEVQQYKHAFAISLAALDKVLQKEPDNINAQLIAARIYVIQDDMTKARSACIRMLGHADLLTVSTCSLEVASYRDNLPQSYEQLRLMVEREGLPTDARRSWIAQVMADMAIRMDKPALAAQWLDPQRDHATVNYWAQWADVELTLGHDDAVMRELEPVVNNAPDLDDALVLRLALAEKKIGGERWQNKLRERVALREDRADTQHASDLARYYLDIQPDAKKALYWAKINWQHVREYKDKDILDRATAFARADQKESS